MWKLWKSASSPCVTSKTALENLWENPLFSTRQFTLSAIFEAHQIAFDF